MKTIYFACVLSIILSFGCDKSTPDRSADAAQSPTVDASRVDAASVDAMAEPDAPVAEAPPAELPPTTLSRVVPHSKIPELVGEEPLGTLRGEAFGDDSRVYGVSRNNCGEGTVLRPIFKRAGSDEFEVAPPVPLDFYGLATGRPVTYEKNAYRITVDVDVDTPERLKGEVKVTYQQGGEEKVYFHLTYDGPVTAAVVPPKVKGKRDPVSYSSCYPTGYVRLVEADGTTHKGLVRIVDMEGKGVAYTRVPVGVDTALQILALARNSGKGIDPAKRVELASARRTEGDVGLLFDVSHRPQLTSPAEAVGANLGTMQKSKVVEGSASLRIWRKRGKKYFSGEFTDVQISSIIEGPLSGRTFQKIDIYGEMVDLDARPLELPPEPEFYKSGDGESAQP